MNCNECKLYRSGCNFVYPRGDNKLQLMVVGEAPGKTENQYQFPFIGDSGILLTRMLNAINVHPQRDCWVTNIVKYQPEGNRTPKKSELKACYINHFYSELLIAKPKIVLCLGKASGEFLTRIPKFAMKQHAGVFFDVVLVHPSYYELSAKNRALADKLLTLDYFNNQDTFEQNEYLINVGFPTKVFVTYHPSALIRSASDLPGTVKDQTWDQLIKLGKELGTL